MGSNSCICQISPERYAERVQQFPDMRDQVNMILDHRCPLHGEKAQTAVWGRHKEPELVVTGNQWSSLGVEQS
jgi:hypothetical protein